LHCGLEALGDDLEDLEGVIASGEQVVNDAAHQLGLSSCRRNAICILALGEPRLCCKAVAGVA